MFSDAAKALAQMFTPPFRTVLLKSAGFAILLLILFSIALHRLFGWLAALGAGYLEIARKEPERCVVIDADAELDAVTAAIADAVAQRLAL